MKTTKRLTLADFKVTKIESQNEIDKLIGGAAAECHDTPKSGTTSVIVDLQVNGNVILSHTDNTYSVAPTPISTLAQ